LRSRGGAALDLRKWHTNENLRQNRVLEQDHRAVKRIARPMLGFNTGETAQHTLAGIELMPMIRKRQLKEGAEPGLTVTEQFYTLVLPC